MPVKILMPALSPTMTEGNLTKWLKQEGDIIKAGEVLAEIETDKATMEVEAVDEGVLGKIIVPAGSNDVAVNSLIAVLLEEGEDYKAIDAFVQKIKDSVTTKAPQAEDNPIIKKESSSPATAHTSPQISSISSNKINNANRLSNQRIFASPLAKRIAAQSGIALADIQGSGPNGRIIKADILSYDGRKSVRVWRNPEEYSLLPNNNMRKTIAKRLLQAKQTIPHFYLSIDCIIDDLLAARAKINNSLAGEDAKNYKLSVNDFVIMASARALKDVPMANSSWSDEAVMLYNNVDISIAVAIEGGLITPIIRNADQKDIMTISSEMKDLAVRAKENKLSPEEYQGGGFSISNLGMYGIKNFSAIVNPPQGAILAVGAGEKKPVIIDDKMEIKTVMNVTLSCDHRVVDGAVGAQLLGAFKKYIEAPILMFI